MSCIQKWDDVIKAIVESYRKFAMEHVELYTFIMKMPSSDDVVLKEAASMTAESFMKVLDDYHISDTSKMHWQRILRGLLHGFITEEQSGYFSEIPVKNTVLTLAIPTVISQLITVIANYSNTAIAGMGIAKKIDL